MSTPFWRTRVAKGMAEVVKPEMFQPGVLEDPLVQRGRRVRMVHSSDPRGGEKPGGAWVLGVLLDE